MSWKPVQTYDDSNNPFAVITSSNLFNVLTNFQDMPPVAAPVDKKPLLAYDPPRWLDEPTYSSSSVQQQPFASASPLQQPNNDQFSTISSNSADNSVTNSRPVDPFVIISHIDIVNNLFL